MWGAIALTAIGTALNLYGQHKEAKAQEEYLEDQAVLRRKQAYEILERADTNIETIYRDSDIIIGQQKALAGKGGVSTTEGSPLYMATLARVEAGRSAEIERHEAQYKADLLMSGADLSEAQVQDVRESRNVSMAGTAISGVAQGLSQYYKYKD